MFQGEFHTPYCHGNSDIYLGVIRIKNKATYSIKNGISFHKTLVTLLLEIAGLF
jgi:hypothetical protein